MPNDIFQIIEKCKNEAAYDATLKYFALQAINNILIKFPDEMISYISKNTRGNNFQSKLFQEYIFLIEKSLPFVLFKNKHSYYINSLLDNELNIFNGLSNFNCIVSEKLEIKNNTQELYSGRIHAMPYFIGKIINIIDKNDKSLTKNIIGYSFHKIKMKDIYPNMEVNVSHLRISPHYQMGGMLYINKALQQLRQ